MRFSLPAITLGAATSLIITAILVFLRNVDVVQNSIIPLGMILIGVLFSFIAIPMHASIRRTFTYRESPFRFLPGFSIRIHDTTYPMLLGGLAALIYLVVYIFGDGVLYGVPIGQVLSTQKTGGQITLLIFLFGFLMFMGFLLYIVVVIETLLKREHKRVILEYGFLLLFVCFSIVVLRTSPLILYIYFARVITGYLLLNTSQERLNTLRDFFIPLFVVLIPLTAYLSGIAYVS